MLFSYILFFLIVLPAQAESIRDVSRLEQVEVAQISHAKDQTELLILVNKAISENKKISIAGARHSQGGHIFYPKALVLDMTKFNRVLALDQNRKIITVESGATWADVQNYANQFGLAVKVMQASNIFTVGGSLSVNAHGRDPRFGSIVETVEGFRLLTADGRIKNVNRQENSELFTLAIGGFGLFGVILDVDLSLTENHVYRKQVRTVAWRDYPKYFQEAVRPNTEIGLHFAWPSISPVNLLEEILVADYRVTDEREGSLFDLLEEKYVGFNSFMLGLSRNWDWGKRLRWTLQKVFIGRHLPLVSRNNAMRPEVKFLEYQSPNDTDILQEYFFPISEYEVFMERLREILVKEKVNLLSATLRFVPKAEEPFMRYAGREDAFSIVLYINQGLSEAEVAHAKSWTKQMVDLSISVGGRYYLAYQKYPSKEQFQLAYPDAGEFFTKKKKYDPREFFMNSFYEHYRP